MNGHDHHTEQDDVDDIETPPTDHELFDWDTWIDSFDEHEEVG